MSDTNSVYLPAPAVCAQIGITAMTLHRWLNGDHDRRTGRTTPPVANFPRPAVVNGRRYWKRAEIEQFMESRAG